MTSALPQSAASALEAAQAQVDAAQADLDRAMLVLTGLLAFQAALLVGLAVHEAGHAVMARRAGLPIRMVRIGRGRAVLRWRMGQAWVVLRAVPLGGRVAALVPHRPSMAAGVGFLLGGILGNAVLPSAAVLVSAVDPGAAWWTVPTGLAQAVMILGNAVPRAWRGRDGPHVTDGERLRRLLRSGDLWSASEAQAQLRQRLGLTEPLPPPSPAWPEIAYQVTRPERLREPWARRDARTILRDLLGRSDLTWLERLVIHDELVMQEAHHGEGFLAGAELDAWSAEAFVAFPTASVRVARAGALCRLGRLDEAEALLAPPVEPDTGREAYARLFAARIRLARAQAELDPPDGSEAASTPLRATA